MNRRSRAWIASLILVLASFAAAPLLGAAADCATGAVRSASWQPDSPLASGSHFLVELNPSGVLDVTDLAGNPFRRRSLGGQTS